MSNIFLSNRNFYLDIYISDGTHSGLESRHFQKSNFRTYGNSKSFYEESQFVTKPTVYSEWKVNLLHPVVKNFKTSDPVACSEGKQIQWWMSPEIVSGFDYDTNKISYDTVTTTTK